MFYIAGNVSSRELASVRHVDKRWRRNKMEEQPCHCRTSDSVIGGFWQTLPTRLSWYASQLTAFQRVRFTEEHIKDYEARDNLEGLLRVILLIRRIQPNLPVQLISRLS